MAFCWQPHKVYWQQDNPRAHTQRFNLNRLKAWGWRLLDHAPHSPDQNPIEDHWNEAERELQQMDCSTMVKLRHNIQQVAHPSRFQHHMSSVYKQCPSGPGWCTGWCLGCTGWVPMVQDGVPVVLNGASVSPKHTTHILLQVWARVAHPCNFERRMQQLRKKLYQIVALKGGNWYRENRYKAAIRY